jgi:hypothetical protein
VNRAWARFSIGGVTLLPRGVRPAQPAYPCPHRSRRSRGRRVTDVRERVMSPTYTLPANPPYNSARSATTNA